MLESENEIAAKVYSCKVNSLFACQKRHTEKRGVGPEISKEGCKPTNHLERSEHRYKMAVVRYAAGESSEPNCE